MAQLAENHGITLFLDPADTGQLLDSSSFLADNGATKDYNYGVFLGNTFKSFPNIAWQSGNDYGAWGPTNDAYVLGIAKGIRSVAPNQLQTVELFSDVEGSSVQTVNLSSDDPAWASFIQPQRCLYLLQPVFDNSPRLQFQPDDSGLRNGVQLRIRKQHWSQRRL
jgi:hypothetical protein